MKTSNFIKPLLIIVVLLAVLSGCKKDVYTGSVKISFYNHPADLTVAIQPMENPNEAILGNLKADSKGVVSITLNPGNYIVQCSSLSTYYSSTGFQVKIDETTEINYGANNGGIVK
jgi:hypothetical protein